MDAGLCQEVSEHDPLYRKAIIQIKEIIKGRTGIKKLAVYYASSDDVLWYNSPKLLQGQERIFLLQTGQATPAVGAGAYTLLSSLDVQPVGRTKQIQQWLQ